MSKYWVFSNKYKYSGFLYCNSYALIFFILLYKLFTHGIKMDSVKIAFFKCWMYCNHIVVIFLQNIYKTSFYQLFEGIFNNKDNIYIMGDLLDLSAILIQLEHLIHIRKSIIFLLTIIYYFSASENYICFFHVHIN